MGNETTPPGEIIIGYKATNENMCCLNFQFELGKWYEHDGEIEMCKSGFHFCTYPSGPSTYYQSISKRFFQVNAEIVLEGKSPGTTSKNVCKRIKLVEEITPGTLHIIENKNNRATEKRTESTGAKEKSPECSSASGYNIGHYNVGGCNIGNDNVGNYNTGDSNTGDRNTGDKNSGRANFGDSNAGHYNTGDRNTGEMNVGDWNTGHNNTGDSNSGHWNKGYKNAGSNNVGLFNSGAFNKGNFNAGTENFGLLNSGRHNTGNENTGIGNAGDNHSGCLNYGKAKFYIFNKQANPKKVDFKLVESLSALMKFDKPIDPTPFLGLPNATPEKIQALHEAHKKLRAKQAKEQ